MRENVFVKKDLFNFLEMESKNVLNVNKILNLTMNLANVLVQDRLLKMEHALNVIKIENGIVKQSNVNV